MQAGAINGKKNGGLLVVLLNFPLSTTYTPVLKTGGLKGPVGSNPSRSAPLYLQGEIDKKLGF